eukprot:4294526-Pyramimonas_sp.AAC.1
MHACNVHIHCVPRLLNHRGALPLGKQARGPWPGERAARWVTGSADTLVEGTRVREAGKQRKALDQQQFRG